MSRLVTSGTAREFNTLLYEGGDFMTLVEQMDNYWNTHEAKEYPGENGKWFDLYEDEAGKDLSKILWDKLFIGSH